CSLCQFNSDFKRNATRIRANNSTLFTALEDANKLAEALDMGAMDYITKPINKVELLARMRVALRLKSELNW
ncbi:response regulator, partial [Bacillus sp. D-CC]